MSLYIARIVGLIIMLLLFTYIIFIIITLLPWLGLFNIILILIIVGFMIIVLISTIMSIKGTSKIRLLNEFQSRTRLEGNTLILPEPSTVEYGLLKITTSVVQAGRTGPIINVNLSFENSRVVDTHRLDLNEFCNQPYLIYFDSSNNSYIVAPGFLIKTGRFSDVIGLCLNHEAIPEKTLTLSAQDPFDSAQAKLSLHKSSYEAELRLYLQRARSARLEICVAPGRDSGVATQCVEVIRASKTETTATGEYYWTTPQRFIFLSKAHLNKELYVFNELNKVLYVNKSQRKPGEFREPVRITQETMIKPRIKLPRLVTIVGYIPGYLKAKLVIDRPFGKDIVKEEVI